MNHIIGILIVAFLAFCWIFFYKWNKNTKKPEGCEFDENNEKCINCTNPFCEGKKKIGEDK